VRDAVSRIRADLPGDLRDPVITKMNVAGAPILTYTVASTRMDEEALSWFVDNTCRQDPAQRARRRRVARVGGVTREMRVELDPDRLLALRATAGDVSRQLRLVQQEASGGRADVGGANSRCAPSPRCNRRRGGRDRDIARRRSPPVKLGELATVSDTVAEQRSAALLNGKPVVGFEITRSKGASEVDVAEGCVPRWRNCSASNPTSSSPRPSISSTR
jgi:multidrug efflux pump subunit AcrB